MIKLRHVILEGEYENDITITAREISKKLDNVLRHNFQPKKEN